jgi:DeoR/GlpR family transcriptional regulator of sugar metabolism
MNNNGQGGAQREPLLGSDRRLYILERIAESGSVRIQQIADDLGVSAMTVRRDVKQLEEDGFLRRSHGGATRYLTLDFKLAANGRAVRMTAEKAAIAREAAGLIERGDSVFLGYGTTIAQLARYIPADQDITVITYSLTAASFLGSKPGVTVISTGGLVRPDGISQTGALAEATLRRFHATRAFIGAGGVSAAEGVTDHSYAECELNRLMVERADQAYVLADSSKLGEVALASVCALREVSLLVTDAGADRTQLELLEAEGLRVHLAGSQSLPEEAQAW